MFVCDEGLELLQVVSRPPSVLFFERYEFTFVVPGEFLFSSGFIDLLQVFVALTD